MNRRHFLRMSALSIAAGAAIASSSQAFAAAMPNGRPGAVYKLNGKGLNATVSLYRGKGRGRITAVIEQGRKKTIRHLRVRGNIGNLGGFQRPGGKTELIAGGARWTLTSDAGGTIQMRNGGESLDAVPAVAPALGIFGVVAGLAVAYCAASAISWGVGKVAEVLSDGNGGEVSQEGDEEEITEDGGNGNNSNG